MRTGRIEMDPRVCGGKPVIKGTRIPVAVLVSQLAEDRNWDDLLKGYPELTREDIREALLYASEALEHSGITEAAEV